MPRSLLACIAACCLAVAAGCRMCANPYDECGPMSGHGCSQECGSNVRAGSILSGGPVPAADAGDWSGPIASSGDSIMVPAQQPKTPARAESPPADGWKSSKSAQAAQ